MDLQTAVGDHVLDGALPDVLLTRVPAGEGREDEGDHHDAHPEPRHDSQHATPQEREQAQAHTATGDQET